MRSGGAPATTNSPLCMESTMPPAAGRATCFQLQALRLEPPTFWEPPRSTSRTIRTRGEPHGVDLD